MRLREHQPGQELPKGMGPHQDDNARTKPPPLSLDELNLIKAFLKKEDAELTGADLVNLVADCNKGLVQNKEILGIISRYDTDGDGNISVQELGVLDCDMRTLSDSNARYAGYAVGFARAFRYLAFTSDFGEALRPVVSARIVTGSYAIAFGYCFADVGWEAYKHHKRGYVDIHNEPVTMSQVLVERSVFQGLASISIPFLIIHSSVHLGHDICHRLGRFKKWGPSIIGLSVIPLLPILCDEPVEHGLQWAFAHYGPWAKDKKKDHID